MPRRSKAQQAPVAAPGQPYGENTDQIQAQNVIPLPQRNTPTASDAAAAPGAPSAGPPGAAPAGGLAEVLAAATATPPPGGGLAAPSTRPGEPITAGLPMGAGPGPEALGPSKVRSAMVSDTFAMLAEITGDQRYRQLAAVAQQRGV